MILLVHSLFEGSVTVQETSEVLNFERFLLNKLKERSDSLWD